MGHDWILDVLTDLKTFARANGMPPTTLRRHLAVLVDCGLIVRRDSPNGKRFARNILVAGSDAAIGSTYNIMPKIYVEMRQCFEDGGIRHAMALQDRANQVIATLFRFGILGGIKALLSMRGLPVGPPRTPHTPLDETAQAGLQEALNKLAFAVE